MHLHPIRIFITGDFCPHNRIEELALKAKYEAIYNDFIDLFKDNDLNITDLECPLTLSENGRNKTGPHQKANPACIEVLRFGGISLAALANNHIMDYGSSGVKDTIELCNQAGIKTVGVGDSMNSAREPFYASIRDKRIAIMNIADQEFLTSPDALFYANPIDPVNNFNEIRNARQKCNYVIVIAHAGNEFYHLPSPRTKALYRFFIDAGADAIISNHTHCFSGFEVYKGKPIFYGLGNFIYDWPGKIHGDWNKGYTVRLLLSDTIGFEIIPLKQCNEIPGVFKLNQEEETEFRFTLEERNLLIADDAKLEETFQTYVTQVTTLYDAFIEPYFGRAYNALRQRGFLPNLLNHRKRLLLLNLVRCESHREVLLRLLKNYE